MPLLFIYTLTHRFKQIKKEDRTVLIIDGDTLGMIKGRYRKMLSELMERFESVVAARMTARQKAEINAIYKAREYVLSLPVSQFVSLINILPQPCDPSNR